ncbi:hypothetical protein LV84_02643 [Algoriphagus ratkowskyi]|uniref:Lipoprotein n=1 Tax=Algoriphagus ratkowskyi TaxID=57028 RepID=A0A2W7R4U0_9BACT|nr:hypothetical protein [Algoriphagus ratkowskyi]PZX55504.1 hypothetical protein LV84_02643 [Algoriphagus ratkowskyi]TXD79582.1 hypothetical protein ESW18_00150 [Algoriphagus ratkowskyi]
MKQFSYSFLSAILALFIFSSCLEDVDFVPELENCEVDTDHFGQFSLAFYNSNPQESSSIKNISYEALCWENTYPIQIGGIGTGNCGDGYEYITNPRLASGISLAEFDTAADPDQYSYKRYLEILVSFGCDQYSTQEKFYGLLSQGDYKLAFTQDDFSAFTLNYYDGKKRYSSLGVDNSNSELNVSNLVNVKPDFNQEPAGNNGLPASVEATFTFSGLLKAEDGSYLSVENAKVRGQYYRQAPWGYFWEDWGKGWND